MQKAGGQTSARPQSRCAGVVLYFPRLTPLIFQTTITSTVGFCFNKHPSNKSLTGFSFKQHFALKVGESVYEYFKNSCSSRAEPKQPQNRITAHPAA